MALTQRHTIYIRCRAPELWAALCEGQTSRLYYYEALVESSFEPGATIRYVIEAEEQPEEQQAQPPMVVIEGEIVAVERERSLAHTFRFTDLDEPATTVRWTLMAHDSPGVMRVEVEHEGFAAEGEAWARTEAGWPVILSGLKTWLETGAALGLTGAGV